MKIFTLLFLGFAAVGCGSSTTTVDMAKTGGGADMTVVSACGHPGDTGNSKHIGQYCRTAKDCPMTDMGSLLCSSLENTVMPANQQTFFCTTTCPKAGPDPTNCGENAVCQCQAALGACGCVPTACVAGLDK